MNRSELLTRIREGRAELEDVLHRFDRQNLTTPLLPNGWSIRDIIAHIGFWERRMVILYDTLRAGSMPQDPIGEETLDRLNARVYNENQLLPIGIVQMNEVEAYRTLLVIAETAPEADLFDSERFAWTEGAPFYRLIAVNTYEHYADHLPDLRAAADSLHA